ncbi:MAG: hypothetical protein KatS3mg007_1704 [Thermoanaerobaculum sp.]|nr:MAG: hypothetical protein KatS3mg007_1704 [Thermoanaerobaculum sp.]
MSRGVGWLGVRPRQGAVVGGGVQDRADVLLLMAALDARQRRQLAARVRILPEDSRKLYREVVALAASRHRA